VNQSDVSIKGPPSSYIYRLRAPVRFHVMLLINGSRSRKKERDRSDIILKRILQ